MSDHRTKQQLALQGGMKSVTTIEGKGDPKIGLDEFMSVAERFGFSAETLKKIGDVIMETGMGDGPFLANYYSGLEESKVQAYERAARELFKVPFSIGTSSGTGALHAAFVAAGVGPGTEVICPAVGFVATAMAVVAAKGVPIFCDVDESLGMDPSKLEALITPRTVALAPTCVMGSVPDMDGIMAVADKHKLKVVEDCAQACGASYKGKLVGTIGDFGCFSISAYKIVGGGEGGLLLTKDQRHFDRASQLVECGGLWRPERFALPRYEGELFCGTNYRMSELEAAIDVIQITKVMETAQRFREVRERIMEQLDSFKEITWQKLNDPQGEIGYQLRFFPSEVALSEKIVAALQAEGIGAATRGSQAGPDWHLARDMFPVTLKGSSDNSSCPFDCPIYRDKGGSIEYKADDCPRANDLYDRVVTISLNQWYTPNDCDHIAAGINKVLGVYCTTA